MDLNKKEDEVFADLDDMMGLIDDEPSQPQANQGKYIFNFSLPRRKLRITDMRGIRLKIKYVII